MESNPSAQPDEMTQLHCMAVLEMQSLTLSRPFRKRAVCKDRGAAKGDAHRLQYSFQNSPKRCCQCRTKPMIAMKRTSETKQSHQKYSSHSNSHWAALEPGERGGRKVLNPDRNLTLCYNICLGGLFSEEVGYRVSELSSSTRGAVCKPGTER